MADNAMFLWSPDTCDCEIFVSFDRGAPGASRTHSYVVNTNAQPFADSIRAGLALPPKPQPDAIICPVHAHLGHTPALYTAVSGENTRRNLTYGLIETERPDIVASEEATFSFDGARKLTMTIDGRMTPTEFARMQAAADLQFGPGEVTIAGTPAP